MTDSISEQEVDTKSLEHLVVKQSKVLKQTNMKNKTSKPKTKQNKTPKTQKTKNSTLQWMEMSRELKR